MTTPGTEPDFLTPKEVAFHARLSYQTVMRAVRAGELSGCQFGDSNRWRIPRVEYLRWMAGRAQAAYVRSYHGRSA